MSTNEYLSVLKSLHLKMYKNHAESEKYQHMAVGLQGKASLFV